MNLIGTMALIGDDIIAKLKASTFSLGDVTVRESYQDEAVTCPMLAVDELPWNGPLEGYADGQPRIVRNIITLESYAKAMAINGKVLSKKKAAIQLLIEADKILNETYGLTMTGPIQAAPYSDQTIFRAVATYTVLIDTQTGVLYRGLS